jgi:hypothetical protein
VTINEIDKDVFRKTEEEFFLPLIIDPEDDIVSVDL